jgi:hypothetical protein
MPVRSTGASAALKMVQQDALHLRIAVEILTPDRRGNMAAQVGLQGEDRLVTGPARGSGGRSQSLCYAEHSWR